jgi:hypothetical protein
MKTLSLDVTVLTRQGLSSELQGLSVACFRISEFLAVPQNNEPPIED